VASAVSAVARAGRTLLSWITFTSRRVREPAMSDNGVSNLDVVDYLHQLLEVKGIVPPGNEASVSKFFDLAMMVLPDGMERTEDEYRRLFEASGFLLKRIVPSKTWISGIEGEPL